MRLWRAVVVVGAIALVLGACSGDDTGDGGGDGGGASGATSEEAAPAARSADDAGAGGTDELFAVSQGLPAVTPRVIKTARLSMEVRDAGLPDAVQDVVAIAEGAGGFVLSTELSDERAGTGTIVVRVPAEEFEGALGSIGDLGDVERRTVSGEDVSEEFVDLEARLRNFEAQEAVLLRLMDRATTIGETIRVQRELTGVQLEVERIRGRLRFLEDRTSLGTITVGMREAGAVVASQTTLEKAFEQAGEAALTVVSMLIVALGFAVPLAALLLIGVVAFKLLRPRFTA
jgi:Domain of unknown function (DUF4349)